MNTSLSRLFVAIACLSLTGLWSASAAAEGALVINANTSDPAPREAFEAIVTKFEAENPEIDVQLTVCSSTKPSSRRFGCS